MRPHFTIRAMAVLNRIIPRLTSDERRSEVKLMLRVSDPQRVVIDPGLSPDAWYVVRGPVSPHERAIIAAATDERDGWPQTVLEPRRW